MNQGSSVAEAPPTSPPAATEEGQAQTTNHAQPPQALPPVPNNVGHAPNGAHNNHEPMRRDTISSISTNATATTAATAATLASNDSATTTYSAEQQSPTFATQGVFSVRDGSDVVPQRRPSRRRTGPLSSLQRERAALIRKLGACSECRRRRVACHPSHHGTTWEEATAKFRSHSPSTQDLAPLGGRPLSPASLSQKPPYYPQDPQAMDLDDSSTQQPGRPPLSETRIRTPLPSGPRPDKPAVAAGALMPLPGVETLKNLELQATASRILLHSSRSRYATVSALLLHWQDDEDHGARSATEELGHVLQQYYNYTFQIKAIPTSDGCKSSWRWLSREVGDFIENKDQRDVLKIVYYSGHSYLDGHREMVLASSKQAEPAMAIRWSGIQQILEHASSDTLIIMDAAYYPSSKLVRREGMLELIAASAGEDHTRLLDRSAFTRALIDHLRTRASHKSVSALSAAELHARLMSLYPKMIQDRSPEKEMITSFPSPLHFQVSGDARLPSILLAPLQKGALPQTPDSPTGGVQVTMTFRLSEDAANADWAECFRWMPEGVKDVRVEGLYRNTFR